MPTMPTMTSMTMMKWMLACLLLGSTATADLMNTDFDNVDYNVLYPMLGKNSLRELSYEYNVTIDDDCNYNISVSFLHSPTFPVGGPDTCLPSVIAEYDGNSMLEGRWFYEEFPQYVQDAIDLNHLSLDYNPCGHPVGGFLIAHYDLHFYKVSPEYRATKMFCEQIPGTPACWPEQYYEEGQKFFNISRTESGEPINMPPGYHVKLDEAVVHMGAHALDESLIPENPADWINPTYVLLTHNGHVICVEPMLPFQFAIGDHNQYSDQNYTYVGQTDPTLPDRIYSMYNAKTKLISVSMHGKSQVCKEDFAKAKAAFESMQVSAAHGMKSAVWSLIATSSVALLLWSGLVL